jgi:hypothetical protein
MLHSCYLTMVCTSGPGIQSRIFPSISELEHITTGGM